MKSYFRILGYLKPYRGLAIGNIIFNLLSILFSVASIAMIIPFLQLLFDKEKLTLAPPETTLSIESAIQLFNYHLSSIIIEQGKVNALIFICVVVVVIFLLKNIFRYLAIYLLAPARNGVVRDIRRDMYDKIIALPMGYFSEQKKGDILSRMTSDIQEIEWCILRTLEVIIKEPITIIAYLLALLYMSPQLTLFVLLMLPVTGLIIGKIGKSLKRKSAKSQQKLGGLVSLMEETLSGLRIIKAFNAEAYQKSKFAKENDAHHQLMVKMYNRRDLSSPLSEFLGIGVVVTVLWFGGKMVLQNEGALEAETFIGFIVLFSQLISPAKGFSSSYYFIQRGIASIERIEAVLDAENNIIERADAAPVNKFEEGIEYRNVSFAYEQKKVLKNISLRIEKGKTIALVGQSGAGKSTLVDLLPRFYDPDEGEIILDGKNIKDYKIKDLRGLMGIVTQQSILFNDTVFNNIAFGMNEASEEAVIEAAKIANAHEFIVQMKSGYHTYIGDQGGKLSGGQRQRLSIARAVLKNPPVLILDEATSALDSESEKLVQEALYNLMQNRTSIVIAHRLSTIQHADEIVVMHEGEIIEQGTHEDLLSRAGNYRKLVELQAF